MGNCVSSLMMKEPPCELVVKKNFYYYYRQDHNLKLDWMTAWMLRENFQSPGSKVQEIPDLTRTKAISISCRNLASFKFVSKIFLVHPKAIILLSYVSPSQRLLLLWQELGCIFFKESILYGDSRKLLFRHFDEIQLCQIFWSPPLLLKQGNLQHHLMQKCMCHHPMLFPSGVVLIVLDICNLLINYSYTCATTSVDYYLLHTSGEK